MKRRGIRISHIVLIACALAVSLFSTWYRQAVSKDGMLGQAGLLGLVTYLLGQLFLNAENEIAIEAANYRVDLLEGRLAVLEHPHHLDGRTDGRHAEAPR